MNDNSLIYRGYRFPSLKLDAADRCHLRHGDALTAAVTDQLILSPTAVICGNRGKTKVAQSPPTGVSRRLYLGLSNRTHSACVQLVFRDGTESEVEEIRRRPN